MTLTSPEFVVLLFFAAVGVAGFICVVGLVVLYGLWPEHAAADESSYPIHNEAPARLVTARGMSHRGEVDEHAEA